ncbi:MAG: hypothetical protein RBU45_04580 [Myxococcota bacterium]|nr:hypothetical protein [Myxococcota bacterium]
MSPELMDDQTLVERLLQRPPPRHLLPPLGSRQADPRLVRRRQQLYRALSVTVSGLLREQLFAGLTEPLSRVRGSRDPVPFTATPEVARLARLLIAEGWCLEEIRRRLEGLQRLWASLAETRPDSWRVLDVADQLCTWHEQGQPISAIHDALEAAEDLWRSDLSEQGRDRLGHFRNFLEALIHVF